MDRFQQISARLARADGYFRDGDDQAASAFYSAALRLASQAGPLPPPLMQACQAAQQRLGELAARYERFLAERLEQAEARPEPGTRFADAVDMLFGRKQPVAQEPKILFYPGMPAREVYPREGFDWVPALEAETAAIREEALTLSGSGRAFAPYVTASEDRPQDAHRLVDDDSWTAFYLWRDGRPVPEAAERCPRTVEAMERVPLCRVKGKSPNVLFSRLAPGVHIPPHTGLVNTRLICHLPLVVPPGCGFRVGNRSLAWREGETLIFDDTIDHEAWNRGREERIILLFEVWQPALEAAERDQVAALLSAVDAYARRGRPPSAP
ncbi:aspartyl/asparaginyl beta-hydroxylase domain-containing protein [Parvularcula oceani]|uniref:aspartyl/asparaginyl beta-hydroxylase domain-containing protein n=1 Tax=Parvularcula oceani TaxID=1247963 RepID=UPI0006900AA3|nr:aspartyl/asparaginyl beta-hydroxylase domain-containing protein [Parvularcula oceani]